MKPLSKLIITFSFITVFIIESFLPTIVYAQEASSSADQMASESANASSSASTQTATSSAVLSGNPDTSIDNPFAETGQFSSSLTTVESLSSLTSSALGGIQTPESAFIKQKSVVHNLSKKDFRHDEPIELTVNNATSDQVKVSVTDAKGQTVDNLQIDKTTIDTQTNIVIYPLTFGFKPGKYTIHITNADGTTSTQDFTWGVLAINFNKSVYTPNETGKIAMAVLDEVGNMVCNANVKLQISNVKYQINDTLSTDNGKIIINPQCQSHSFSLSPDYEANYQFQGTGDYAVTLTATTKNGTDSIDDTIKVVDAVPFDVERVTATRIYPPNQYPVIFHIKANQDFHGTVTEYAPANFDISPYATGSGTTNASDSAALTYSSSSLVVSPIDTQTAFGVPSVSLVKPFVGNYPMIQGFGVKMTDPEEAPYYASFGLAGHDGLDFAMPTGTQILAADDGTVSLAGDGAYGTMIAIDHVWGRSYYGHLSTLEVKAGDKVFKGQEIGLSGATGHVTGPHLHFGIKPIHPNMQNGFYGKVDPMPYVSLSNTNSNQAVLGISTSTVGGTSMKVIRWNNISIKTGDSIDLAYAFKSPGVSPAFYTLGPLTFQASLNPQTIFSEQRQWELAIDSSATNNCTVTANDAQGATITWGTVGTSVGACANAGTTVTGNLASSGVSEYLKITGFGFNIPSTATIQGIQFSIKRTCSNATSTRKCVDNHVYLYKAGTLQSSGTDQKASGSWPTTATTNTYGSSSTISWGGTWLYSDVNDAGFGIGIQVTGGTSSSTTTATITGIVTATITYNSPPNAPTGLTATSISTTSEQLQMSATDPDSDSEEYKVVIYTSTNGTCSGVLQTDNQTSSQSGWDNTSYTSGATATYTATGLSKSTTYDWNVAAIDPTGTNTFGSFSTCSTFTVASSPRLDLLMRHGEWFDIGVANMPTFDVASSKSGTNTTSISWTHTTTTNSNRLLIVGVSLGATTPTVSSVTYNGVALTNQNISAVNCASSACRDEIWYLVNPPTGANTVQVTLSGQIGGIAAGAMTFYNVNQINPFGTAAHNSGSATPSSLSVTSTSSQVVVDSFSAQDAVGTWSPNGSQTQAWLINGINTSTSGGTYQTGGSSSTSFAWTNSSGADFWADIGVPLNGSTSGGGSQPFTF